jgi:FKBP-type peptidyl-prolyl cis-trans isomerases 2
MTDIVVAQGTRVTLHFSLALADGTLVDSTFDKQPATFEVGDGSLLPHFEQALFGMSAGDEKTLDMPPEKAFGQHNESNIQVLKRSDFAPDMELEPGLVISFADANRAELPGVVTHIDDDRVTVDFNHPLAGHRLVFRAAIINVEPQVTH